MDLKKANEEIRKDYPIQDDTWPSRWWNKDRTKYCDFSGEGDDEWLDSTTKIIKDDNQDMKKFKNTLKGILMIIAVLIFFAFIWFVSSIRIVL